MAKYKLRGDYTFYDKKGNPLQNELNADKSVKKAVIIDDKECSVEGQEHKLELVKEVKVDTASAKQGNTAKVQQSKPVQVQPVQSAPGGVQAESKPDPEQSAGDK